MDIITTKYFDIIEQISKHGFEAVFVGGCVRDTLLGEIPKDIDIATNAKPEELQKIFKNKNIKIAGASFPVMILDNIEIATYRKDIHNGIGDLNCKIEYANNLNADLSRRDFTINGMAYKLNKGQTYIIDPFDGQRDLENRLIRFIGSPEERIKEDPNRILRACRFATKIQGEFHPDTLISMIKFSHYVKKYVKPERIRIELIKVMDYKNPSLFFEHLHTIGILQDIFPSLYKSKMFIGHGFHHIESVFTHLMLCGDALHKKNSLLRLAGFLHDIGKPYTAKKDSKNHSDYTFYNHEIIGAEIAHKELYKLKFSNEEIKYIVNLIKHHMHTFTHATNKGKRKLLRKLIIDNVELSDITRLRIADRIAHIRKSQLSKEKIRKIISFKKLLLEPDKAFLITDLKINGNDIMSILHINPSPLIGAILKKLLALVLEEKIINNREILIEKLNGLKNT